MSWLGHDADRRQLQRELAGDEGKELLHGLRAECQSIKAKSWQELEAEFETLGARRADSDGVVAALLRCRHAAAGDLWQSALLLLFWPQLESIHRFKAHWDRQPETRWANLCWCFLQGVHQLDLDLRGERFGQKLLNDTIHRLHDHYREEWARRRREVALDDVDPDLLIDSHPGIDFEGIELRSTQRSGERELRRLLNGGRITRADYDLELGTRIYGGSLGEYAAVVGLNYQVAKKRRQRLEAGLPRKVRR